MENHWLIPAIPASRGLPFTSRFVGRACNDVLDVATLNYPSARYAKMRYEMVMRDWSAEDVARGTILTA